MLGGGLPLGAIIELNGAGSSGRTTLALSTLAGLTRRGHCCAYVDACDALDPLSAAALGVELRRLLWVRPPEDPLGNTKTKKLRVPHNSLRSRDVGPTRFTQSNPYFRLDRALRATDLLLNAGGWSAVVLDMGELPPAQARRVPLATWYRFRLQAEKSRALLLLLTPIAGGNAGAPGKPSVGLLGLSCAAVSLRFDEAEADWRRAAAGVNVAPVGVPGKPVVSLLGRFGVLGRESGPALLAGLHYHVALVRGSQQAWGVSGPVPQKPATSEGTHWSGALMWPG